MIEESEVRILKKLSKYLAKFVAVILSFFAFVSVIGFCNAAGDRDISPVTRTRALSCDREKTKMMRLKIYWIRLIKTRDYYCEVKKLYPSESNANKFLTELIKGLDRMISEQLDKKQHYLSSDLLSSCISENHTVYDIVYSNIEYMVNYSNFIGRKWFPSFIEVFARRFNIEPQVYLGKASNGKHYCFMYDYRAPILSGLKLFSFEQDGDIIKVTEE